jgi:hypothetical protein
MSSTVGFSFSTARADVFSAASYESLTDASSSNSIPIGTKITRHNWQQYRRFIPPGTAYLYEGSGLLKIGDDPEYTIEIGPSSKLSLPRRFKEDTEKYAGQARLRQLPSGGFAIDNYAAGIPFPNGVKENNPGPKVLYNLWYSYTPALLADDFAVTFFDRYMHTTDINTFQVITRLTHVSDIGLPQTNPAANGYYIALNDMITAPEQTKYTTTLALYPEDTTKVNELYVFLPSLRRSLRLSTAARCSPLLGTDWTNDDNKSGFSGMPNLFKVDYLGRKRVIAAPLDGVPTIMSDPAAFTAGPLPGWPRPKLGKFTIREADIIDAQPVGELQSSYCYSHRVMFLDAESYNMLWEDLYDRQGKLWKTQLFTYRLTAIEDGFGSVFPVTNDPHDVIWDVENNHTSVATPTGPVLINAGAPQKYHDASLYASPGGLNQIMK